MSIGLRKIEGSDASDKPHALVFGETGRGKTHYGSTCPDPIAIGFDDRVFGVKGNIATSVNSIHGDIFSKILDRNIVVFLAHNNEYIEKVADLNLGCNTSKVALAILKKKKMGVESLIKITKKYLKKNPELADEILGKTPISKDDFDKTLSRIEVRNEVIKKLEENDIEVKKDNKKVRLAIFTILFYEAAEEGFQTINIDDGKEFVNFCRDDYMQDVGIDEIGDLAHGKGYYDFRKRTEDQIKKFLSVGPLVNMYCHEGTLEFSDEGSDEKHLRFYPNVGDKQLNLTISNWFTLVGRATMLNDCEGAPYRLDFTPKKYAFTKSPYHYGMTEPIENTYEAVMKYATKK